MFFENFFKNSNISLKNTENRNISKLLWKKPKKNVKNAKIPKNWKKNNFFFFLKVSVNKNQKFGFFREKIGKYSKIWNIIQKIKKSVKLIFFFEFFRKALNFVWFLSFSRKLFFKKFCKITNFFQFFSKNTEKSIIYEFSLQ